VHRLPERPLARTLTLIGFMGIGKTTVGEELAGRLDRRPKDSDALVEAQSNRTIRELFDWFGEPHFRELERGVIATLAHDSSTVLSVGGGAFMDAATRRLLLENCTVIYLAAPWSYVQASIWRLKNTRPLLRERSEAEIEALFHERHLVYDQAHVRVSVPRRAPAQVAGRILALLGTGAA